MKITSHLSRRSHAGRRAGQRGSAVIVVLAFLAIMLIYVDSNLQTLGHLNRDLKLVERRQLRHWEIAGMLSTNAPPARPAPAAAPSGPANP